MEVFTRMPDHFTTLNLYSEVRIFRFVSCELRRYSSYDGKQAQLFCLNESVSTANQPSGSFARISRGKKTKNLCDKTILK